MNEEIIRAFAFFFLAFLWVLLICWVGSPEFPKIQIKKGVKMLNAEEARELTKGSTKRKGTWYKCRLTWVCGLITQRIEKEAELGNEKCVYESSKRFAKLYYPIMATFYEKQGYFVAYNSIRACNNEFVVSWADFSQLPVYRINEYMNDYDYNYYTKSFEKYIKSNNDRENEEYRKAITRVLQGEHPERDNKKKPRMMRY